MSRALSILTIAGALFATGCVSLGWKFGPGFSSHDKTLFQEPPVIVQRAGDYYLSWTQGTDQFFFQPDYRVKDGRLVFALVATSSSGNLAGRYREMKLDGAGAVLALRQGGAYWWERDPEPTGTLVPLKIEQ